MERDMAFMEKRPDSGRWYVRYKDTESGRWRRKSLDTTKKLEANQKFADFLRDLGERRIPETPTVKGTVALWLREVEERDVSEKHLSAIRLGAKELCAFFGNEKLINISRRKMRDLLATHQSRKGYGARNKLALYRQFFRWAVAERYIPSDPTHGLGRLLKPAAPPKRTPRISDTDLVDLIAALSSDSAANVIEPLVRFLAVTGVRSIDATRLTWADVDLESGLVRITPGKGKGTARLLPCPREALPPRTTSNGKVFGLSNRQLTGYWRRFKSKVGNKRWKGTSLHSLRVRVNSKLVEAGHEALARAMLGHADVDMTAHYTRVFGTEELAALTKL